MPAATRTILISILALAAALRFAGLDFGLPLLHVRPDEYTIVAVNQTMAQTGSLNPHYFVYPGLSLYLYFAIDWLAFTGAGVLAPANAAKSLAEFIAGAPDTVIWIHRLASAAFGTATILVAYRLGCALSHRGAGLAGALLTAVAYLHVRDSHFGTVDVPTTFTVCLTLLAALRHVRVGTAASLFLAAALAGLAAAQKYNAGLTCVSVAVAHMVVARRGWRSLFAPRLFAAGLITGGVFLAAAPYTLLDLDAFRAEFDKLWVLFCDWEYGRSDTAGPFSAGAKYLIVGLRHGLGEPMLAAAVLAVGAALVRGDRRRLTVVSFVLVYVAAMSVGEAAFFRYMMPVVPVLAVLAADGVVRLAGRISHPRVARAVAVAVVLGLAVIPAARSIAFNRCISRPDTRVEARNWLVRHVACEDRVMAHGWIGHDLGLSLPDHTFTGCHPGDLLRGDVRYFVIAGDHPLLGAGFPGRDRLFTEILHTEIVFESVGLEHGVQSPALFDRQDVFLIPYAGFADCIRPGPTVRILRVDGRRGAASAPPGAPRDFTSRREGRALRLDWSPPSAGDDVLCTLVYLVGRRQVGPGFRVVPKHIFEPNRTTARFAWLDPGHYWASLSFVGPGGESAPSRVIEFDWP